MMEAFLYCWTDVATNKLYVGWHKGNPGDGYICSSQTMIKEYTKRPGDFIRQVLATGTCEDMFNLESKILNATDAMNSSFFYNKSNNFKRGFNGIVKGMQWWNNGVAEKRSRTSPGSNWHLGRLQVNIGGYNPSALCESANKKRSLSLKKYKLHNPQTGSNNPNKKTVKYNGTIYPTIKEMTKITGLSSFVINKMIKNNQVEIVYGRK